MTHKDCQILFDAGKALLAKSGLARFNGQHFVACNDEPRFDKYWKAEFHPEFGRYIVWVLFSVGARKLGEGCMRLQWKGEGWPQANAGELSQYAL